MTNLTPERLAVIKLRFVAGAMRAEDLPALIAECPEARELLRRTVRAWLEEI